MQTAARKIFLICLFLLSAPALAACSKNGSEGLSGGELSALKTARSSSGPFGEWKPSQKDERYLAVLKSTMVEDRVYSWNTLASAIIVRALPYSPTVAQAAEYMYGDSPYYHNEVGRWGRSSAFKAGAPVVVLLGLYSPKLGEKDLTKLERFRPILMTADGRALAAIEIKRYGRASTFVQDHFPVFDHWEEVYMVKFPAPAKSWQTGPLTFRLEWPGGTQNLTLNVE